MLIRVLVAGVLLGSLEGCGKSPGAALGAEGAHTSSMPARRPGLWIQTMSRDGAPGRRGDMRMCIDAATDDKISFMGQRLGRGACQKVVTRGLDGAYAFTSTCAMPGGGRIQSSGVALGDFQTSYKIHSESSISGAMISRMNGHHVTDITGRYQGPCPSNMAPGDIALGYGLKFNVNKASMLARALGPG
jgi:hypothetical protein